MHYNVHYDRLEIEHAQRKWNEIVHAVMEQWRLRMLEKRILTVTTAAAMEGLRRGPA